MPSYNAYKLYSEELINECRKWMDDHNQTYEEEDFSQTADANFHAMRDHLLEKGFSQLDIDEMKFVPWRPNYGPNNDWVIPEGFKVYELGDNKFDCWEIMVKEGTDVELFVKMLHKAPLTKDSDALMWKIYEMDPKNIIIFESSCAEYFTSAP